MSDLKLINMEDVEVEEVKWLIYPFIPYGKITIIQGDPGEGKTTLVQFEFFRIWGFLLMRFVNTSMTHPICSQ